MCHVLPLHAGLAEWDLILEPITHIALEHQRQAAQEDTAVEIPFEEQILRQMEDQCKTHYHLSGKVVLKPLAHWQIEPPACSWYVEILNAPKRLTPQTCFNVRIISDHKVYATYNHWTLQAEHRVMCLTAKHNLSNKMAVDINDFNCEERDVLGCKSAPFPTEVIKGAFMLKKRLKADEILCEDAAEKRSLVTKGNFVDVFVKKGFLTLNVKAIALDSGCLDAIISVKNISSNKVFQGKVVDENTVQVAY